MKLEITRACFYKNAGGLMKKAIVGEIVEIPVEMASELIACQKGFPGDYPAVIEIECLQNFDSSDANFGAISGKRGDHLKLPRELATRLIFRRLARPVDSSLWSPSLRNPPPLARDFTNEAEVLN
jgi:hypothetical protein